MPLIALFSSLCGGQTCVDMADFAENNEAFLRQFMRLEHGPPSHDSFSRLFRMIEPVPFAAALARFASDWAKELEAEGIRQIAVDGKALRRAFSRAEDLSPLHLAGAFAPGSGIVLGQVAVDKKSNEIRALPALLEMLDLKDAIITADAMHTRHAASELIISKGGDYFLALKSNQKALHADAKAWLEGLGNAEKMLFHQQFNRGHGREETRTETCFYIMIRKMSPEDVLKAVRSRWAIKNKLHWVLDVQMREDELQNRRDRGPENLAAVRRLVLSIVQFIDDKLSVRRRFLRAAQVPVYRLGLIGNAAKLAEKL